MVEYLIRLTPVDTFFFGGEQGFGFKENQDYFALSNRFPQQTTLLGMLRKEILIQSPKFEFKTDYRAYTREDKAVMATLIGPQSFSARAALENRPQDFGAIQSLSPVFILRGDTGFIPAPLDQGLSYTKEPGFSFGNRAQDFIPELEGYDPKKPPPDRLLSQDGKETLPLDEVFSPVEKIGITKDRRNREEGQFFKHLFYRLAPGFSFGIMARLDHPLSPGVVTLGGENAPFVLTPETGGPGFGERFTLPPTPEKLTLVSDSLAPAHIYNHCEFALTRTQSFRHMKTSSGEYAYETGTSKSSHYTLFKRGSVFFSPQKAQLEDALTLPGLQAVGYNIFT